MYNSDSFSDRYQEPYVPPEELRAANERHDLEHGDLREFSSQRIRSSWSEGRLVGRGPLTDKKIAKYAKAGWFSADFKEARRSLMLKKHAQRKRREGNFDIVDGRMIYRP
jgi:hypothetical protein